jgi:tRNA dimethylallyltransferase
VRASAFNGLKLVIKQAPPTILLMGPTTSGKTAVALELAHRLNGEIISVDSALVYRDMNIGTAKPDAATLRSAPHHLIDLIDPTQSYSAAQFRGDALKAMSDITARGKIPILAGGTMLYFKALMEGISALPHADPELRREIESRAEEQGWPPLHAELANLDPETAARLKPTDSQRIQRALEVCYLTGAPMSQQFGERSAEDFAYDVLPIALLPSDRSALHRRIDARFAAMLEGGLIDEVQLLRKKYELTPTLPAMRAVGYRQVWDYLDQNCDGKELAERGAAATRQLAKRQLTWLRAMGVLVVFDCLEQNLAMDVIRYVRVWHKG